MVDGDICNTWNGFASPYAVVIVKRYSSARREILKGVLLQLTHATRFLLSSISHYQYKKDLMSHRADWEFLIKLFL